MSSEPVVPDSEFEQSELAPHSREAEEAVLGAVLINSDAYYTVASFLTKDDFFILRNGWIWQAIINLHRRGEVIEYITIIDELKAQERLDTIGGPAYITYLASNTATSVHAETYGRIVYRAAIRRRLLAAADDIANIARKEDSDIEDVIGLAEGRIFEATAKERAKDWIDVNTASSKFYDRMEAIWTGKQEAHKVRSFIPQVDKLIGGYKAGKFHIAGAGRPGDGKSNFLVDTAVRMCQNGLRVGVMPLEMDTDEWMARIFANLTGIDSTKYGNPQLMSEDEWETYTKFTKVTQNWHLFIDDTSTQTPESFRSKFMRLKKLHDIDVGLVDYLQLFSVNDPRGKDLNRQVTDICAGFRQTAKDLDIPILAAAQLSRAVESEPDHLPKLKHLRESGSIEQDAYTVMFLHQEQHRTPSAHADLYNLIFAKNRGGPTGVIQMWQRKAISKFQPAQTAVQQASQVS